MKILLAQLPNPQFEFVKQFGNTPLAAGYLKCMAEEAGLFDRVSVEIMDHDLMNLGSDRQIIRQVTELAPDILGFTLYLWNIERSLYLASEIKKALPDLKIIVGGPEVAPDNAFLLSHDIIDLGCHKEGELTFIDILKYFLGEIGDLEKIPGIFYRRAGEVRFTEPRAPISDLNLIPSPFLRGYLDPTKYPVASIETSRGCHNKCKYCSWENRAHSAFTATRVGAELKLLQASGVKYVKFINADILSALTRQNGALADEIRKINTNRRMRLFGFLSAERVNEEKADMLQQLGFTVVGVGLQSVNPRTLAQIGRKPDLASFVAGCRRLTARKIGMEFEFIIGLPHDALSDYENIFSFLAEHDLVTDRDMITPFLLLMLPGTTIRREVEEHGLVYNPHPPYQLIRSSYLSKKDIQKAIDIRYPAQALDNTLARPSVFSQLTETYAIIPNQAKGVTAPSGPDWALPTVRANKAILTLNAAKQATDELSELGKKLGEIAYQPFTLWLKSQDMGRDIGLIRALLVDLLDANPFLLLNLILEVDNPCTPILRDHLLELPLRSFIIRSTHILPALHIGILQPWGAQCSVDSLRAPLSSWNPYHCWTLSVKDEPNWDQKLKEIITPEDFCFIVDLGPDASPGFTARLLRFIVRDKLLKNRILFRRFELNAALSCFHVNLQRSVAAALGLPKRKMVFDHPPLENIVVFDDDLHRPKKLFTPGHAESATVKTYIKELYDLSP